MLFLIQSLDADFTDLAMIGTALPVMLTPGLYDKHFESPNQDPKKAKEYPMSIAPFPSIMLNN